MRYVLSQYSMPHAWRRVKSLKHQHNESSHEYRLTRALSNVVIVCICTITEISKSTSASHSAGSGIDLFKCTLNDGLHILPL